MSASLRILSLNVHEFSTDDYRPNFKLLEEFLPQFAADVIMLQEAVENTFKLRSREPDLDLDDREQSDLIVFAKRLGFAHVAFGAAHTSFGVAILSRRPILKCRVATISRHRVLLLAAVALADGRVVTVCNVHLNHRLEKVRLDELDAALAVLQSDEAAKALATADAHNAQTYLASPPADEREFRDTRDDAGRAAAEAALLERPRLRLVPGAVLVGDFNALSLPEHYLAEQWQYIERARASAHWEEPRSDVWRAMRRAGWLDCWLAKHADQLDSPDLQRFTVWAKSRIDYVFALGEELADALAACDIHKTTATDHNAVVADFQFRPAPAE